MKIRHIIFIIVAATSLAFGQGSFVPAQTALKDVNGVMTPIGSATITVCPANAAGLPCTPANVSIFSDAALTQPKTNPFTADQFGNYQFAVASGTYTITVTASGFVGYSYQVSTPSGGTSSATWSSLPGGTNTTSNFNCGTGCSIGTLGSGTIAATSVPFSGLGGGTNTTGSFNCGNGCSFSTTGSGSITATAVPWSGVTTGSNTAAQTMGGAGSFTPVTGGQIGASEAWSDQGLPKPALTLNVSGGSILSSHTVSVVYTLVTARGETVPSVEATLSTAGCTGGNQCQVVVTAPTASCGALPCGPYTGYTVYSADQGTFTSGSELKQTASTACVNITTSCTINVGGAGAAFSMTPSAFVNPPNLQASAAGIANGLTPSWYVRDWSTGNTYVQGGMIGATNANFNDSTFTEIRRHWFNNCGAAQTFSNSFLSINHCLTNLSLLNQNRGLSIEASMPTNYAGTFYALEGIQVQADVSCNGCTINGSPDGELTAGSYQLSDTSTANYSAPPYGTNGLRVSFFKNGAGVPTGNANGSNVAYLQYSAGNSTFAAGTQANLIYATCTNGVGGTLTNVACNGLQFKTTSSRFNNGQVAVYVPSGGGNTSPVAGTDWIIRNDIAGYNSELNGVIVEQGVNSNTVGTFTQNASTSISGSLTVAQGSLPTPASVTCSGGASTYSYALVGVDANGGTVISANQNSTAACANPLTSGNPATVTFTNSTATAAQYAQFIRLEVWRTGGPMALGKVGNASVTTALATMGPIISANFVDTGLSASGTAPTSNTTGGALAGGDVGFATSKGQHFITQAANNDYAGTCTLTSATPSTCTVTFTRAFANAPVCVATNQTTQANPIKAAPTTTNVVFTGPNTVTDVVAYICVGNPN